MTGLDKADRQAMTLRNIVLISEESVVDDARDALEPHLGVCFEVELYTVDSNSPTHYWTGHRIPPSGMGAIRSSLAQAGVPMNSATVPCVSIYVGVWNRAAVLEDVDQKAVAVYASPADDRI